MNHCQKPRRVGSNGRDIQIIFSIFWVTSPRILVLFLNRQNHWPLTWKCQIKCTTMGIRTKMYFVRTVHVCRWNYNGNVFTFHFKLLWKAPVGSWINVMTTLKILTNEKKVGLNLVSFVGLPLSCSRWDFQKNLCRPHPVKGLPIRIHLSEAWIRGSGSTPKFNGSATLVCTIRSHDPVWMTRKNTGFWCFLVVKSLLSEPCLCHLKSTIVSQYRHSVGLRHTSHSIHQGSIFWSKTDIYSPPPSEIYIFSPKKQRDFRIA